MDKTKIVVNIFDKYAQQYQDKFMDVDIYNNTFDLFCTAIKKENAEILELACGPGNITKYLLKKRSDFKLLGTDLSSNMIALAKLNNPTAEFELMDCREISTLSKKYDGLMCGFCFPYLSKEETIKLITDAYRLLNSNGVVYISTMEDDYTKSGFKKGSQGDEMYMHYHEADYLIKALEEINFKIIDLQRKDSPPQALEKTTDLIIIAIK